MVGIVDHHHGDAHLSGEPDLGAVDVAHQIVEAALLVGVGIHELPGVQFDVEPILVDVGQHTHLVACRRIVPGLDVSGELGNHAAVARVDAFGVLLHQRRVQQRLMEAVLVGVGNGGQRPQVLQALVISGQQTDVTPVARVLQVAARPGDVTDPIGLNS